MKNSLNEILDKCSTEELDVLLKDLDMALSEEISADKVFNIALKKSGISSKRKFRTILTVAVCAAMLTAVITGGFVIAEAVEYDNALKYCNENHISVKGLSREDIKSVYRNITTETYYYSENKKNLPKKNIFENSVSGYNIQINSNNNYNGNYNQIFQNKGIYYDYNTAVSKYDNNKRIWSADFTDFDVYGYLILSDNKLLVYGETEYTYLQKPHFSYIALLDDNNGEVLWKKKMESTFINTVAENKDGSITVFGISNNDNESKKYIQIRTINGDGEIIKHDEIEMNEISLVSRVSVLEKGWLAEVQCSDNGLKLLKIDENGTLTNSFSYHSDTDRYDFEDFTEFNGKVYISAVSRPKKSLYEMIEQDISDEKLLPYVREEFTSVLLVCDLSDGSPKEFYSVKGSMAEALSTDNQGNLIWNVNRILSSSYSPSTSSFSLTGVTRRYEYTFGKDGSLESEKKTDDLSVYHVH